MGDQRGLNFNGGLRETVAGESVLLEVITYERPGCGDRRFSEEEENCVAPSEMREIKTAISCSKLIRVGFGFQRAEPQTVKRFIADSVQRFL